MSKKSPENIWKCLPKPLIFAPASREKHLLKRQKQVLKNFWKIFKKDLQIRKKSLPLHPLRLKDRCEWYKKGSDKILKKNLQKRFGTSEISSYLCNPNRPQGRWGKKVLKNFWKNLSKRFGGSKNNTYLCTSFRWKTAVGTKAKVESSDPPKRKKWSY